MPHYYEANDLERFDEIGKYRPELYAAIAWRKHEAK